MRRTDREPPGARPTAGPLWCVAKSRTFDTLVRTIAVRRPVRPFSHGQDQVRDVTFERHLGDRVYEIWHVGTERDWDEVLA